MGRKSLISLGTAVRGVLCCLVFAVVLLVAVEWYRQADSESWLEASALHQVHLELIDTLRLDLATARYTAHALAHVRTKDLVTDQERQLDASLIRARECLLLLHRGGGHVSGVDGSLPAVVRAPLSSPILERASQLVPLIEGLHDQSALLLGAVISGVRPDQNRLGGRDPLLALSRMDGLFVQAEGVAEDVAQDIRRQRAVLDHEHEARAWSVLALAGGLGLLLAGGMLALVLIALGEAARLTAARSQDHALVLEANAGMTRLLEALPVGVALLDRNRAIRHVNLAATNMLDIEPSWSGEKRISWDMFCPQAREVDQLPFPRARFELEAVMRTLEGRLLDVLRSSIPLILHGETLTLEVFMDITRRKQAEQALLREKSRLESLLAGIDEGVALTDANGIVLEANTNLGRMLGRTADEWAGVPVRDLFPANLLSTELSAGLEQLRADPHSRLGEIQVEDFRGLALVVRMQALMDAGGFGGMIVSVIEVTQIVESRRKAEAASQAKSMFLANMSHEIRTPMNSIVGHGELLAGMPLTPEQSECVRGIRVCADSLLLIINDILDFSKIEAGMMRIVAEPVDLAALLSRIGTMFGDQARSRGLQLGLSSQGLPPMVQTDPGRLSQVLINLVGNAIKFTDSGRVDVVVRGEPAGPGRHRVFFEVRDTGIGISADRQKTIFESFEQADGSLTRQYGGTGLGLTIANSLVRLLGGAGVDVQSEPGSGSVFSFVLTHDLAEETVAATPEQHGHSTGPGPVAHARVLAVEDNAFNRSLLAKMLQNLGVRQVTMVENGQEAVDLLQANRDFDLVLMDIQMPVLDGLEATRRIRAMGLEVPIVALTAHALEADQHKSLEAGMNGHLSKPYRAQELARALATWCGSDFD